MMAEAALPLAKAFTESTHRSCPPAETLARYGPLVERIGVTRLANVTGLDCIGVPVVVAVRPTSRGLSTSQGKGLDLPAAKASALMEAIETWHAERIETTTCIDTVEAMERRGATVDLTHVARRGGRGLAKGAAVTWVRARELIRGEDRFIPLDTVSCDFSADVVSRALFLQSTNGLASGNHRLEAVLHGLCELIERDAVTLHNDAGAAHRRARRIDLATVDDPRCGALLDRLRAAGVDVALWDATSDVGVPVVSALIVDSPSARRFRPLGAFRGYGCHPSRAIAAMRALTEAVQSRLTYISGSRDDLFLERYRALQRNESRGLYAEDVAPGGRPFSETPTLEHPTFDEDLRDVLSRLRAVGLDEVVAFDLTRADVGVPVVKMLVPGLENDLHASPDYVPGPRATRARRRAA